MPINNIKNTPGVMYMKINELGGKNTEEVRGARQNRREVAGAREAGGAQVQNRVQARVRTREVVRFQARNMVENAVNRAVNIPEVREERVAQIKQQVQAGTYNVSNREIARAMIGNLLNEIA